MKTYKHHLDFSPAYDYIEKVLAQDSLRNNILASNLELTTMSDGIAQFRLDPAFEIALTLMIEQGLPFINQSKIGHKDLDFYFKTLSRKCKHPYPLNLAGPEFWYMNIDSKCQGSSQSIKAFIIEEITRTHVIFSELRHALCDIFSE